MSSTHVKRWNLGAPLGTQSVNRRRFIAGGAALGAGAASLALVGCSGGDDDSSPGAGLVSKPVDTSSRAVRGGIHPISESTDVLGFDALAGGAAAVQRIGAYAHSRLLKFKVGTPSQPADGTIEGDAAASWETSPDGMQFTFRLRPDLKFDARPPTSGRALRAQDVVFSFDKYARLGRTRTDIFNSANAAAPVTSVQAPDNSTVILKLAYPFAPMLALVASTQNIVIQPTEADGGYDPRSDMRGSGAWILDKYTPSSAFTFKRNPNYYIKDRPFLDGIDLPIVTEYATGASQFVAGGLAYYGIRQEEIVPLKRQQPALQLQVDTIYAANVPDMLRLSTRPGVPYADVRVRQAMAMLIDRQLLIDLVYNTEGFTKEGLPVSTRVSSHVSPGWAQWVDPTNAKDMGAGARHYAYNPAEAKKLLKAAGFTSAIQDDFTFPTGPANDPKALAIHSMLQEHGDFKLRINTPDFNTVIAPRYNQSRGDFDGILHQITGIVPDLDSTTWRYFHSKAGSFYKSATPDAEIDDLLDRTRMEFDSKKRDELYKAFQRRAAEIMPAVPVEGLALEYGLSQPWLQNYGFFHSFSLGSGSQEHMLHLWIDPTKKG